MPKLKPNQTQSLSIYQGKNGSIEFRGDFEHETIWASLNQIAELFDRDKSVVSRHIQNIYREAELDQNSTVAKNATVQEEGGRKITRTIEYYNLDVILMVGYRVNGARATEFRQWATKVLKQHLVDGYTINKRRVGHNYDRFIAAMSDVKAILPPKNKIKNQDVLELVKAFASTWLSLDAYDKARFPKHKQSKKSVAHAEAVGLSDALKSFKAELIKQKQATELFGQEKKTGSLEGIVGNVFQAVFGKDVYPSDAERAANLLYFIVKNHPFNDGNKRSGAFAFVWFLRRVGLLRPGISPEAVTAITLLVAESNPKDKEKMIGLILLLIR